MNTNARTIVMVKGWASAFALAMGLLHATPAAAVPIRFSTSGTFDLPSGPTDLIGASGLEPSDNLKIGSIKVEGIDGPVGDSEFHVRFKFDNDLPTIDVSGAIRSFGYNPDMPVLHPVVSTSATSAQVGMYPEVFQNLLAHPDWIHTSSFRNYLPEMSVVMSVHPQDPGALRPVPEPSSILFAALACAGLAWRARRGSSLAAR